LGHVIYVLFGFNGQELGDVHAYDTIEKKWRHLETQGGPSPRSVLGAAVMGKDRILVWGGEVSPADPKLGHMGAGSYSNEGFLLDVSILRWYKTQTKGTPPSERGWFATTTVPHGVAIHGGYGGKERFNDLYIWTLDL